ncbi:MAG: DUF1957 domain-containing protein [bacterium]|nr:DUF1957 domain-containing protein [bacterium]
MGKFSLVLHSHLPWVISHGKWPHGSVWLVEAATECYIPLIEMLDRLISDKIQPNITIGITPVLAEQLADPSFASELIEYLELKITASIEDKRHFQNQNNPALQSLSEYWEKFYWHQYYLFRDVYHQDLLKQFKRLQDSNAIEIITCAATHGYSPLLGLDESIYAQFATGVDVYRKHFGKNPLGTWLPECAYRPAYHWSTPVSSDIQSYNRLGVEEILDLVNLRYFIVDSHLLEGGKPIGVYLERFEGLKKLWEEFEKSQVKQPEIKTTPLKMHWVGESPDKHPVAVFTRHPQTTLQVWSGEHGYPGDGYYLDFHKKHFPGGNRYWRVTSAKADLGAKEIYQPEMVEWRLNENSDHFVELVNKIVSNAVLEGIENPIVCAPFDTELFGHWWFEGIRWIEKVIRKLYHSSVHPSTLKEVYQETKIATKVKLPEGSWGEGGFHHIWLNQDTAWTWEDIYQCEIQFVTILKKYFHTKDSYLIKLLEQLARELMLIQSSDWQFLISTVAARDYSEMRFRIHHHDFMKLVQIIESYSNGIPLTNEQKQFVQDICIRDSLFQEINLEYWLKDLNEYRR